MTRNEAAERLREWANGDLSFAHAEPNRWLDEALAAERRATAERFYNMALGASWDDEHGNRVVAIDALELIRPDVEAAR